MNSPKPTITRKKILETYEITDIFNDKVSVVMANLRNVIPTEHWDTAEFNLTTYYDPCIEVRWYRDENDEELEVRLRKEASLEEKGKKRKEAQKDQEYKTYLRLQKKFGDKNNK